MHARNFGLIFFYIIFLLYLELGESATISRIAFVKDANLKPKCSSTELETFQKPVVMLRLTKPPQNDAAQRISEEEVDEDMDEDENEDNIADAVAHEAHAQNGYKLVELSKSETLQLIESGKLQLVESADASPSIIELYNGNANDVVDEDDDERSKKRPWRKIQRVIRRQLIKKPTRYFKRVVHTFG
ncbi:uncharacterized protein LOC118753381 [Rhagoletis pomonella]|uniref:uncharacterized protein LOC118753381 n=1 Tax=Rhagoletis pomonella TaxID=28610 RepID=UPI00177FD275|nr:uncharacterized protein LOC118753381 [Rhagoletis pomonella]